MTIGEVKNIRNLALIDRLYNLFKTEGGYKEPPQLESSIQPVVDIHKFNQLTIAQKTTGTTTSRTDTYTVPAGYRWILKTYSAYRSVAGSLDLAITKAGVSIYIASNATLATWLFGNGYEIVLDAGDSISFTFGASAASAIESYIIATQESV